MGNLNKDGRSKFNVKTTFSTTGEVSGTALSPHDAGAIAQLRVNIENVGGGNEIEVYGKIRGASTYDLLETITGPSTSALIDVKLIDEIYFDCTTYSASGGIPTIVASGFFFEPVGGGGSGLTDLNGLTTDPQNFATATTGTNFAIVSSGSTHTFRLPVASATNTGKLSSTDWSTFNGKQDAIDGTDSRVVWKDGSSVSKSLDTLAVNAYEGLFFNKLDQFNDSEAHSVNQNYLGLDPQEDAPNTTVNLYNTEIELDPNDSGFDIGSATNSANIYANNVRAEGTGDIGSFAFQNNNFVIGDGTNPFTSKGWSYSYGFGEVKSGITVAGPMQGYGFQPNIRSGSTVDPTTGYAVAFYDTTNYEGTCSYHTSFNASPTITSIPNGKNYVGLQVNPQITTNQSGSGVQAVSISGNYGTFGTNAYFNGININPTITSARSATGVSVSMDSVTLYAGVKASLVVQDLTIERNVAGADGNNVTIEYTDTTTAGNEVASIAGSDITVTIESGVSTALQVKAALEANFTIASNIDITVSGVGSNPQVTQAQTNLAGGIDPGNKQAAYLDGDVQITGSLQFGGALSIGKLSAFGTQDPVVDGGGNPTTVHGLISGIVASNGVTTANCDTLGVNTAALITIEDNSINTSGPLGIGLAALGLPAVLSTGAGSTVDNVTAAVYALSLDGGSTGGTVDRVRLCRSVVIPNGITTINKLQGFAFDLPFGDVATDTWGIHIEDAPHNYLEGTLKIGDGTAKVASSSVLLDLESTTRAVLLPRMDSTAEGALTGMNGMIIYNTTTNKFRGYASGAWVDLH